MLEKGLQKKNEIVNNSGAWLDNLTVDRNSKVECTVDNMVLVLENDENLKGTFAYNEFNNSYEYIGKKGECRVWSDTDDAKVVAYLESAYGIYNENKYRMALNLAMMRNKYNPLKELIEHKKWDGVHRIDNFLKDILKCDCRAEYNNDYYREVSRMIFYGGIARLYTPGVKFDYMPILIGRQGAGKSTIVDWLALNTRYYKEVTTIDGKDGIECLEGGWICEFSELLAMTRQKDVQALKAFITRTADKYRKPYDKYVSTIPRCCVFIGTTNDSEFLTDMTGNRRYLPVEVGLERGALFEREEYVKEYIISCWREALWIMKNDKDNFYLTIPSKYQSIVDSMQERRVIEDPRLSELDDFLSSKEIGDKVCSRMIWAEAFKGIEKQATRGDFKVIGGYMSKFEDWERVDNTITFEKYGKQKYWVRRK